MDRTLIICKPDAVRRRLTGEILGRFERKGLTLVAASLRQIDADTASRHYEEHHGKPFYDGLVSFITGGLSLVAVIEGPADTWKVARNLIGATDPSQANPGTIRGDFGLEMSENLVHGSDSAASALRETAIFFPDLPIT